MFIETYLPLILSSALVLLVILGWWHTYLRYKKTSKTLKNIGQELAEKMKTIEHLTSEDIIDDLAAPTGDSLIVAFDPKGVITYTNDHAESFFGYTHDEMVGHTLQETILPIPERKRANEPDLVQKIVANPKLYINVDLPNRRKDNTPVWVSWTYRLMYSPNNELTEIRAVGFDVSKRKQLEQKIQHITSVDVLTGVLKRTAFMDVAEQEVRRAVRYGRHLSLLVLKLDYLRLLGQDQDFETGEQAIKQVIKACQLCIREMDILGRIDDVEFALLLPETPYDNLSVVADRLYLKLQEMSSKQKILFGKAVLQSKDDTIDSMLQRAEKSLSVYSRE